MQFRQANQSSADQSPAASGMAPMRWAKGVLRLLVGLAVGLFVFFIVSIALSEWRMSKAYAVMSDHTLFPYLHSAFQKGEHIIQGPREFSSAVCTSIALATL